MHHLDLEVLGNAFGTESKSITLEPRRQHLINTRDVFPFPWAMGTCSSSSLQEDEAPRFACHRKNASSCPPPSVLVSIYIYMVPMQSSEFSVTQRTTHLRMTTPGFNPPLANEPMFDLDSATATLQCDQYFQNRSTAGAVSNYTFRVRQMLIARMGVFSTRIGDAQLSSAMADLVTKDSPCSKSWHTRNNSSVFQDVLEFLRFRKEWPRAESFQSRDLCFVSCFISSGASRLLSSSDSSVSGRSQQLHHFATAP